MNINTQDKDTLCALRLRVLNEYNSFDNLPDNILVIHNGTIYTSTKEEFIDNYMKWCLDYYKKNKDTVWITSEDDEYYKDKI